MSEDASSQSQSEATWEEAWQDRTNASANLAAEYMLLQEVSPAAMYELAAAVTRQKIASIRAFPEMYIPSRINTEVERLETTLQDCHNTEMTPGVAEALVQQLNLVKVAGDASDTLPTDSEGLVHTGSSEINTLMNSGIVSEAHDIAAERAGLEYCIAQYVPRDMLPQTSK